MSQIKVTITDERGNVESVGSTTTSATNKTISKQGSIKSKEVKKNQTESKALAVASMISNQSFNYMKSNVGKWTGSTRTQTQVNNAMQLASLGAMLYVSPAIAVANVGLNLATTAMDTAYEQRWDKYAKEQAQKRAGELKGRGR